MSHSCGGEGRFTTGVTRTHHDDIILFVTGAHDETSLQCLQGRLFSLVFTQSMETREGIYDPGFLTTMVSLRPGPTEIMETVTPVISSMAER